LGRLDGDLQPQVFQPADEPSLHQRPLALVEEVPAQIRVVPLCWPFTPSGVRSWHSCGSTAKKSSRME